MHACFGSIQINCLCEIVRDCCMHNNCIFFKIKFFLNYLGRDEHSFWITRDCTKRKGNLMRWNQRNCPSLSRPFFFFLLDYSIQWFSSTFCAFLGTSAKNELILSCFCFIQKVVEMRLFFSEVAISCQGLTESANFLLWVRPIKLLLFIDELKVRAFLSALPKPSNAYTLCSLDTFKKRH